jgi:hypothetical protein
MNTAMPIQQRGLSFGGFIFGAFLLVFLGITGLKLIPAYMQAAQIKNIFVTMAHDPDMQKATVHEIQVSFNKRASIDNISAIKAEDIEVSSEDGRMVLSASYDVKIPLSGNVSFLLTFNPSSASK